MVFFTQGTLTIGTFIVFLILGYNLYIPIKVMMIDYPTLTYMNQSLNRILTVLDNPILENGQNRTPKKYDIDFKNVSFGYTDTKVLNGINFHVDERSLVALV